MLHKLLTCAAVLGADAVNADAAYIFAVAPVFNALMAEIVRH